VRGSVAAEVEVLKSRVTAIGTAGPTPAAHRRDDVAPRRRRCPSAPGYVQIEEHAVPARGPWGGDRPAALLEVLP